MAAWFDRSLSQGLDILAFPLSTFPISCGAWVRLIATGIGTQCVLSISTAAVGNYVTIYVDNAGTWTVEKTLGGTAANGAVTLGEWHYVLMRVISATSVRFSLLNGRTGAIAHANLTTAGTMTGFDTFSVGDFRLNAAAPTNFLTGGVGELFITDNDCYSSGGQQAENNFIRRLAYDGPLQMNGQAGIKNSLLEYRSLISAPGFGNGDEVICGSRGMQAWTNLNGVLNGPHPPLPPGYAKVRPPQPLMII